MASAAEEGDSAAAAMDALEGSTAMTESQEDIEFKDIEKYFHDAISLYKIILDRFKRHSVVPKNKSPKKLFKCVCEMCGIEFMSFSSNTLSCSGRCKNLKTRAVAEASRDRRNHPKSQPTHCGWRLPDGTDPMPTQVYIEKCRLFAKGNHVNTTP